MKKLNTFLFGAVIMAVLWAVFDTLILTTPAPNDDNSLTLYRVITEDNDTTFVNAKRWDIYGESKQYIIFYQSDRRYSHMRSYVGNVKSVVPMEDDEK